MQHFYDGQIRRYLTQIIRLLSNFSYKDGDGDLRQVPVMYGDITRQVAHIIRDNSENKIPSAPRIGVYVTDLAIDRDRTSDSSYTNKVHIRERAYDSDNNEYLNTQGKNYTVERLMPTPYTLSVKADIWSTNTDQKLQIMEQILMLFNPSLEIQTTDNYIDWTSLTVVNLDSVTFSSRSIPVGTESEIDVGSLQFTTPIYISPPVKVKKMGVITNVIMSIFDESNGTINLGNDTASLNAYNDSADLEAESRIVERADGTKEGTRLTKQNNESTLSTTYRNYDLIVLGNTATLGENGQTGVEEWEEFFKAMPGKYVAGVTQIQLKRTDLASSVNGTVAINELDPTQLIVNWDTDTIPSNTVLEGPTKTAGTIDYIIDPMKFNPTQDKQVGIRLLILNDIGNQDQTNIGLSVGPNAWKNSNGTDFIAGANDIIEWTGSAWEVIFDASENASDNIVYTTNLNTGVQYKYADGEWILSFEGEYHNGSWRVVL